MSKNAYLSGKGLRIIHNIYSGFVRRNSIASGSGRAFQNCSILPLSISEAFPSFSVVVVVVVVILAVVVVLVVVVVVVVVV